MADENITPRYHGRRRGSLPAMKLGVPLLPNKAAAFPQSAQLVPSKENSGGNRSGSLTKLNTTSKNEESSIKEQKGQKKKSTIPNNSVSFKNQRDSSPKSEDSSSGEDAIPPDATKYNRGRRHSVDVLVASPERPLLINREGQTHKVWAQICKVSDPKYFDAKPYNKEDLPQGSSLFKAVLADLEEKEEEEGNPVPCNKSDSENTKPWKDNELKTLTTKGNNKQRALKKN